MYSYEQLYKDETNRTLKELFNVESDYSNKSITLIFDGDVSPHEKLGMNTLISRRIDTVEDFLNLTFEDTCKLRNVGRGIQTLLINRLLSYLKLPLLQSEQEQKESHASELKRVLNTMEHNELQMKLLSYFESLSPIQQKKMLIKLR